MRVLISLFALLLIASFAIAEEPGHACPSDHAANKGFNAFGAFHEVMAPTWHQAYPDKDYAALLAAGPKFDSLFKGIADIEPSMKNSKRKAAFLTHREQFATLVNLYAEAAKAGLQDSCYALMPAVHEAFEQTAAVVVPYSYPELEGAIMTAGIITEQHLPKNNAEGITGSTETLVAKVAALNEKTIPEELKDQQDGLLTEFSMISKISAQMKECCDKNDMENYKKHANELSARLKEVSETYL
ncbi:MAG: hypothetical protein NDJ18_07090 [candidate division Zixibacteria bacterium]|nr:hypothetical protein [candidate division Zixibacteria bacterium]